MMRDRVTRFAPSPTGRLHLGHAHSALFARQAVGGGRYLLRIEDIDRGRCRPEFEAAIYEDLAWLGIEWETPVRRQSDGMAAYAAALAALEALGVLYPCFCTRKEIAAEIERAGYAPHGPEGPLYPGVCRGLTTAARARRLAEGAQHALRLDAARATDLTGALEFSDRGCGRVAVEPRLLGDVVLARKDIGTSYHLAVVVDDALQGVTLVARGEDLLPSTHVHRVLQALLDYAMPEYHHHGLLTSEAGRRLSKRDGAATLEALRAEGVPPAEVRGMAGFPDPD